MAALQLQFQVGDYDTIKRTSIIEILYACALHVQLLFVLCAF
jgi:hypothetical protein